MGIDNFFYYLLKVTCLTATFFVLYKLLFEKLNNFKLNRIYLLSAVGLSWFIPLINFGGMAVLTSKNGFKIHTFELISGLQPLYGNLPSIWQIITFNNVAYTIYYLGIFMFLIKFTKTLFTIYRLTKTNSSKIKEGFTIFRTNLGIPSFSFFKLIFLNDDFRNLSKKEQQQVILHEKTHVRHFHSIDVIFIELATVFLWFNPFIRLIKKSLQNVHEFEADLEVSKNTNKGQYLKLITNMVISRTYYNQLFNSFGSPQIKKRLEMLTNRKKKSSIRMLIFIPLFFTMLSLFGGFSKIQSIQSQSINRVITTFKSNELKSYEYNKGIKILFELIRDNVPGSSIEESKKKILLKLFPEGEDFSDVSHYAHTITKLSNLMGIKFKTKDGANISEAVYYFLRQSSDNFEKNKNTEGVFMVMNALVLTLKYPSAET